MALVATIAGLFAYCAALALLVTAEDAAIPKWFGIDIDGTFYTKNHDAFCENIEAFKRAKDAGYNLFFCTGRQPKAGAPWLPFQFVEKTGYNGCPGVYCNGAAVLDENCNLIEPRAFPTTFIQKLLQLIQENNYEKNFLFFDGKDTYRLCDDISPELADYMREAGVTHGTNLVELQQLLEIQVLIVHSDRTINIEALKNINDETDIVIKPSCVSYDITLSGVTKASGVLQLAQHFNFQPKDIAFIGDGVNDIEVMQQSDYSCAVANAPPEVSQHAKHLLTKSFDQAGFAEAVSLLYNV